MKDRNKREVIIVLLRICMPAAARGIINFSVGVSLELIYSRQYVHCCTIMLVLLVETL